MLELGVKITLSYLLGSVMGGLLIGQLYGGVDIRKVGSGNAGGTNALRTQGKLFAFWVMVVDVGKAVVAVLLFPNMALPWVALDAEISRELLVYAVAFAAVVGHVYPIWFDFRGGKGAATAVGAIGVIQPTLLLPLVLVWLSIVMLTGYVGLATVCAAVSAAVYVAVTGFPQQHGLFIFTTLLALFIVFTHRENIRRMWQGTENRFSRGFFSRGGD